MADLDFCPQCGQDYDDDCRPIEYRGQKICAICLSQEIDAEKQKAIDAERDLVREAHKHPKKKKKKRGPMMFGKGYDLTGRTPGAERYDSAVHAYAKKNRKEEE